MCKICVSKGLMTQAELDEANAKQTDQADFAARVFLEEDPAAFLAALLGETKTDPETEADKFMNENARILLEFVAQQDSTHGEPDTSVELAEVCSRDAGRLMFKLQPSTIALSLAVITRRYAALLEQWAGLYVKAAIGDDDTIDLDAARTAEAKEAVTRASGSPEHKTGMYL